MEYENEITVEVDTNYANLLKILNANNFNLLDDYQINDIYMINDSTDKSLDALDLLKNCILIRDIITKEKEIKMITYKYKKYNNKREIIKQGKINCHISSLVEAKELFQQISYKEFIKINDHIIVFGNVTDEFAIELVNDKHIYIEIEQNCNRINKKYLDIEEMKMAIKKYNIPIKNNNYFVKKAEIEIHDSSNNKNIIK
jgi:adenylate cyclase class IV